MHLVSRQLLPRIFDLSLHPVSQYRIVVWSTVELGVGILCACLPTYRPLLRQISTLFPGLLRQSQRSKSNSLSKDSTAGRAPRYNQLHGKLVEQPYFNKAVGGMGLEREGMHAGNYRLNQIYVESRVEVVWMETGTASRYFSLLEDVAYQDLFCLFPTFLFYYAQTLSIRVQALTDLPHGVTILIVSLTLAETWIERESW